MRRFLFWITFDDPWTIWTTNPNTGQDLVGAAIVFLIATIGWAGYILATGRRRTQQWLIMAGVVGSVCILLTLAAWLLGHFQPGVAHTIRIPGYGFMIGIGFIFALPLAQRFGKSAGLDPDVVTDAGFWLLITAVAGGRVEYLRQYGDNVMKAAKGPGDALWRAIDISEGGLVLVGALIGGTLGMIAFASIRKISPWLLLDVIMPSAFLGIGFGRLGCLLNGCCFGDPCTLPWGISFPDGSLPYQAIVERGFLSEAAKATMPLHPTQIYMSIDGFIMAGVTSLYFPLRRWNGELLAISAMCYALSRFLIEFLRWDEMGQIATALTISQKYSLAIFAVALASWIVGQVRYASRAAPHVALKPSA